MNATEVHAGYLTVLLLLLIIVPVPHVLFEAIRVHCPCLWS
jgi:hypothetical protein